MSTYNISIFTNADKNGKKSTFKIEVDSRDKARSRIHQILKQGYLRAIDSDSIEWYAPSSIVKITATGPNLSIGYSDTDIS